MRALYVQGDSDAAGIDSRLGKAVQGGFDTVIYLCGSSSASWNSTVLPTNSEVTPTFDPLAYAITKAHALGLKLWAWWCAGNVTQSSTFRTLHPTWDIGGVSGVPAGCHWLNWSATGVDAFIVDVMEELAAYHPDGIHGDYWRYWSKGATNTGGADYPYTYDLDGSDITAITEAAYNAVKAVHSDIAFTLAVYEGQGGASNVSQDWTTWLDGGYLDWAVPMNYCFVSESQGTTTATNRILKYEAEWLAMTNYLKIAPAQSTYTTNGPGGTTEEKTSGYRKTGAGLTSQLDLYRSAGFLNFAVFDTEHSTVDQLTALAGYYPPTGGGGDTLPPGGTDPGDTTPPVVIVTGTVSGGISSRNQDYAFIRGATKTIVITLYDANGDPLDLTATDILWVFSTDPVAFASPTLTLTNAPDGDLTVAADPTTGVLAAAFTYDNTKDIPGVYYHKLTVATETENTPVLTGRITIY